MPSCHGAGKSSLADRLARSLCATPVGGGSSSGGAGEGGARCTVIHGDDYFFAPGELLAAPSLSLFFSFVLIFLFFPCFFSRSEWVPVFGVGSQGVPASDQMQLVPLVFTGRA